MDARDRLMLADRLARGGLIAESVVEYVAVADWYSAQGFGLKAIAVYRMVISMVKEHAPTLFEAHADLWDKLAAGYRALGLLDEATAAEQRCLLEPKKREQEN
jgi:hypothetical protein